MFVVIKPMKALKCVTFRDVEGEIHDEEKEARERARLRRLQVGSTAASASVLPMAGRRG
jgi:hypothetical protein